jgi:lipoate-protein ligase A
VSTFAHTVWEHLPLLATNAARQMAIDAELVRLCGLGAPRAIVRLYRMDPPAVTIGRHQRWRSVIDEEACGRRGWEWTRRPTGGGALLHCHEINYAVAGSHDVFGGAASFRSSYEQIMRGLAHAVELLGGRPTMNLGRESAPPTQLRTAHGLCEQSLTHFEISVSGKKAVAAAQLHFADAILQHGTIYLQAPTLRDRFWPPDAGGQSSQSPAPAWWDTSGRATHADEGVDIVANAIRDGLTHAGKITWSSLRFDRLDHQRIEAQLHDWDRENWNRRR